MYYQHRLIFKKKKTEITEYGLLKLVVNILLDLFGLAFLKLLCVYLVGKNIS